MQGRAMLGNGAYLSGDDGFYLGPLLLLALEDGRDIAGGVRDAMQGGVAASAESALDGGADGVGVGRSGGCFSRGRHGERWGGGCGELRTWMEDDADDEDESGDREERWECLRGLSRVFMCPDWRWAQDPWPRERHRVPELATDHRLQQIHNLSRSDASAAHPILLSRSISD